LTNSSQGAETYPIIPQTEADENRYQKRYIDQLITENQLYKEENNKIK
jgi:hypothetical protein